MSFAADMAKFKSKLHAKAEILDAKIGGDWLGGRAASVYRDPENGLTQTGNDGSGIVGQTTIDTGCLVSNWNISVDAPDFSFSPGAAAGDASSKVAEVRGFMSGIGPEDKTVYLTNATPYGLNVEFAIPKEWNWQQPTGWIREQAGDWERIVKEAVSGISV